MLPFDSDDNKETARQTIYEPVPFTHPVWEFVSSEAKDLIKKLMEKDRTKRIRLEEVLDHPWIVKKQKSLVEMRRKSGEFGKFEAYTATFSSLGISKKDE